MNGVKLKRVNECKYLGIIVKDNMSNDSDIKKSSFMFMKQFSPMYSKLNYVNTYMLKFLFKSYFTSFYDAELWFDKMNAKKEFNRGAIAYHKSIKRMAKQSHGVATMMPVKD